MAIGFIMEFPGVTAEQYDVVKSIAHPTNQMPAGGLSHAAAPMEGGWRVMDLWQSQEAFDTFFRETLSPALATANINVHPNVTVLDVHNFMIAKN
jgi:hypothetical protein